MFYIVHISTDMLYCLITILSFVLVTRQEWLKETVIDETNTGWVFCWRPCPQIHKHETVPEIFSYKTRKYSDVIFFPVDK
jgi:hypothetical protein